MMPEVQPAEYRLYSNMGYFMMTWVIPAFMTIVGGIFFYFTFIRPAGKGPPPLFAVFFLAAVAWIWYRQLRMPHRIVLTADGQIEFVAPARRVVVTARDIVSIRPERNQFGYLVVRWGSGKLTLLNQFDGFHELLTQIKNLNPAVEFRGC